MPRAVPPATQHAIGHADSDACYLAFKARDARFDGHFFVAVSSTGIYCRPVCKVRLPKRENCSFYPLAAQAEAAGYRPCLRCRPELAGTDNPDGAPSVRPVWSRQDASNILAYQALELMRVAGQSPQPVQLDAIAAQLGIAARHLRRIFVAAWGVTPSQYVQTQRLLRAKQLLSDTQLPLAEVAARSGFGSVRRLHAVFVERYRLQPGALRRTHQRQPPAPRANCSPAAAASSAGAGLRGTLGYRQPYDAVTLLRFLQQRSIPGVEDVQVEGLRYCRSLALTLAQHTYRGWVELRFVPEQACVAFFISDGLLGAFAQVQTRLRELLDLDADPLAIEQRLGPYFPGLAGLRVPGTLDGFELAVRAILGQQVTVAGARTLTVRLVQALGTPLETSVPGLCQLFPTPAQIAQASADALGALGIVRQRQTALRALAQAVRDGHLVLHAGAHHASTMQALQDLPGIGPWTAHYIAMRALRWPDAFPGGDVALQKALGVRQAPHPARAAEAAAQDWQPWRSYAVVRAWHTLAQPLPPNCATSARAHRARPAGQ